MITKIYETSLAANDVIPTLNNSSYGGLRNTLINGNFDIWQRGTSLSSGSGFRFLADRWSNSSVGTTYTTSRQSLTVGTIDNGFFYHRTVVTSVAGVNNYCVLEQKLEGVRSLAGQTVTLSFYAKADSPKNIASEFVQVYGTGGSPSTAVTGIGVKTYSLTTSWQKFSTTFTVPNNTGKILGTDGNDYASIQFWFDAGSTYNSRTNSLGQQSGTFDITQVQLEPGITATPFELVPYSTNIMLCQRYFEQSYDIDIVAGTAGIVRGMIAHYHNAMSNATRLCLCNFRFSTIKRATPIMKFYSPSTGAVGVLRDESVLTDVAVGGVTANMSGGFVFIVQTVSTSEADVWGQFTADAEI